MTRGIEIVEDVIKDGVIWVRVFINGEELPTQATVSLTQWDALREWSEEDASRVTVFNLEQAAEYGIG